MKLFFNFLFFLTLLAFGSAYANEPNYLHAKGHACEDIKANEGKSAARIKVNDKAGFDAVSKLDLLQKHKNNFNEHDFNVMIYELIDSALEGISVQTISEDERQICVEFNAMADEKILHEQIGKHLKERGEKAPTDIVIEAVEDTLVANEKQENASLNVQKTPVEDRALLFVATTTFYNGATSDNHSRLLKHYLADNENFYLTDTQEIADFIIYPKVEKAKIDESNEGLKRLQMQTVFTIVSPDGEQIAKDEQNRAIICAEEKTEQQNAQDLLKKMFAKSAKKLSQEIEKRIKK